MITERLQCKLASSNGRHDNRRYFCTCRNVRNGRYLDDPLQSRNLGPRRRSVCTRTVITNQTLSLQKSRHPFSTDNKPGADLETNVWVLARFLGVVLVLVLYVTRSTEVKNVLGAAPPRIPLVRPCNRLYLSLESEVSCRRDLSR